MLNQNHIVEPEKAQDADVLENVFIFALVWSVGGALRKADRLRLDEHVKALSGRSLVSVAGKSKLPKEHTLFDYCFDVAAQHAVRVRAARARPQRIAVRGSRGALGGVAASVDGGAVHSVHAAHGDPYLGRRRASTTPFAVAQIWWVW